MRITNSSVSMSSARTYQSETQQTTTHLDKGQGAFSGSSRVTVSTVATKRLEVDGGMTTYVSGGPQASAENEPAVRVTASKPKTASAQKGPVSIPSGSDDWLADIQAEVEKDPRVQALRKMLELLERISGKRPSKNSVTQKRSGSSFAAASASYKRSSAFMGSMQLTVGPALHGKDNLKISNEGIDMSNAQRLEPVNGYWLRQTIESGFVKGEEHTAYSSVGTAVTADGRTIDFGITLEMSRSFEAAYEIVGKEEIFTDPLVINLDTDAASLSDVSFYFDLDADGKEEEISTLGRGSGFLALDKNGDGKINDGSELFGARTGNGFGELSQYDQDSNGWIDEGDEVFSKLKVWTKCGSGEAKLLSLKDAGVGAIFLGSHGTQFTLADKSGNENAVVRRTGMYLKENGQAGTIQHVDFKA